MRKKRFYYILSIQYLGFRYHGWQNQPNVITVEGMFRKTIRYVLSDPEAKVLASGRTDAKVSANQTYIELFTHIEIKNISSLLDTLNYNLPADIRILDIDQIDKDFNIIQHPKIKTYHYYFSFGEKFHPFTAAFMCHIHGQLDIDKMKILASDFIGKRDFYSYTYQPKENTNTISEVKDALLEKNTEFTASFFPEESYVFKVKGEGFKRNQIRLMMGALIDIGKNKMSTSLFKETLNGSNKIKLDHIAPASGLVLHEVVIFDK
tara:strand:+ start:34785 stop:35573 length:789 start_codon:yes stop_codon:yes gene_type:complete